MAEFLVIRLGVDPEQAANWITVDSNGTRSGAPVTGALADAAGDIGDRSVIVLVPATTVLTTTVNIPIKGGSRLLAALPFALEEQLADDIDNLHFAAGKRRASGQVPVAVVAHEQMSDWLARLDAAGLPVARIVPENYGLARIPGTMSLLSADDQIIFNDGADNEFVMQGASPSDALAVAGALEDSGGEDHVAGHLLVYCESGDEERFQQDWIALRHELASVDINLLPDGALPRLAVTVAAGNGVNLLQGRYGAKTEIGTLFRPWRYAAILFLTLGLLTFGGKVADYYRLTQEETVLKTQFEQVYRSIRPGDQREIVDPVATVNSVRRSLGGPSALQVLLPSLVQLGQALQQNQTANIEAISYRAGVIDVRLTAPDVATLDAAIQSTDQVGDKVNSRIQIREAGA